jgi:hypothetical protein
MYPRMKKKELSRCLAGAVLSYCCAGDLKGHLEYTKSVYEEKRHVITIIILQVLVMICIECSKNIFMNG